jgi:ParB/RepB/Spo0J family partition protein
MRTETKNTEDLKSDAQILCLPCSDLKDHPFRMPFYVESHVEGLLHSISERGLLEPLLVCPLENGSYRVLSGHYRLRVVRRLRWKNVLCRVIQCDLKTATMVYCTANLLTRGLSAIEEAHIITKMVKEEAFTAAQIGKLWGRSKSWVSRRMSLLVHLSPHLKKDLQTGHLSPRTAQELLRLPQGNDQQRVFAVIQKAHLNKDEAAQLVGQWLGADETCKQMLEKSFWEMGNRNAEVHDLERNLKTCTRLMLQSFDYVTQVSLKVQILSSFETFQKAYYELEALLKHHFIQHRGVSECVEVTKKD